MTYDVRVDGKTYRKFDKIEDANKSRDEFNAVASLTPGMSVAVVSIERGSSNDWNNNSWRNVAIFIWYAR